MKLENHSFTLLLKLIIERNNASEQINYVPPSNSLAISVARKLLNRILDQHFAYIY